MLVVLGRAATTTKGRGNPLLVMSIWPSLSAAVSFHLGGPSEAGVGLFSLSTVQTPRELEPKALLLYLCSPGNTYVAPPTHP